MKRLKELFKRLAESLGGLAPVGAAALAVVALSSCSSAQLKRCDAPLGDASVMKCDKVQGAYYQCEKAQDMYQGCVTPQ